jgi:hypothetical protein
MLVYQRVNQWFKGTNLQRKTSRMDSTPPPPDCQVPWENATFKGVSSLRRIYNMIN